MTYFSYKVPGGKMIKISVLVKDKTIKSITILGDFFLHPEDALEQLEEGLRGVQLLETQITKTILNILDITESTLIGATANDFSRAIIEASKWTMKNQ